MKTKVFLVNRHTGKSLPWNESLGREIPHYSFFKRGDFAKTGHVVELVELAEIEAEYFGIMYRKDELKILQRGQLEPFGMKPLE